MSALLGYRKALVCVYGTRLGVGLVLVCLAAFSILLRWRYVSEPLENDITFRMVFAAKVLEGARPFVDLFAFGPPVSVWINQIVVFIFGVGEYAVFLMGCFFFILALLGIYRLTADLADATAGIVAATIWTALAHGLLSEANQPNAEVVINALVVWSLALCIGPANSAWRLVLGGVLMFAATGVKHFVLVVPVLCLGACLFAQRLTPHGERHVSAKRLGWRMFACCLTVALLWLLLLLWHFSQGTLKPLLDGLIGKSLSYAAETGGGLLENLKKGLWPYYLLPADERRFFPLALAGVAGVAVMVWHKRDALGWVLVAWALAIWVGVSVTGRFYAHYYTLWYPWLACTAGIAACYLGAACGVRVGQPARHLVLAALPLATFAVLVPDWLRYGPAEAPFAKYGQRSGTVFTEARAIGQHIASELSGQRVFELGASGVYFYARASAPAPFADSLFGAPDQFGALYLQSMRVPLLKDLPELLVIDKSMVGARPNDPRSVLAIEVLAAGAYREVPGWSMARLALYRRSND
jgi:hypothetical protein